MMAVHLLEAEAAALHTALFGGDVPDDIAGHYAAAHAHALTRVTDAERQWMARAVETRADLEALEIALRVLRPGHVLTRKMRLLVYLAEASPRYYCRFVNEEPRRVRAFFALIRHGARTMLKFAKGWLILKARDL
jgi:hypothetical protein